VRRISSSVSLTGLGPGEVGLGNLPVLGTHDFKQVGGGDLVTHDGVEDVVEAQGGPALVAHALHEEQRIGDAPAGGGVDRNELFAPGRDLIGVAIPGVEALVEAAHFLDEGQLEMQSGIGDGLADRRAELDDDGLLGLVDGVGRREEHDGPEHEHEDCADKSGDKFVHINVLLGCRSGVDRG
jgi:hypothetical protein